MSKGREREAEGKQLRGAFHTEASVEHFLPFLGFVLLLDAKHHISLLQASHVVRETFPQQNRQLKAVTIYRELGIGKGGCGPSGSPNVTKHSGHGSQIQERTCSVWPQEMGSSAE